MHEKGPARGLKFARAPGYFPGAPYFGYPLSIPPGLAILLLPWRRTCRRFDAVMPGALFRYLPPVPVATRWARVIWICGDRYFGWDPLTGSRAIAR